ncbi:MAG TPA: cytochrome c, partial [Isosphaeraceae bacterium]|nr:cytochrome c [Isosphaeraceae bacterium]
SLENDGETRTIAKTDIEDRRQGEVSIMPGSLVNALGSKREFLDLVRYLVAIAEGGPEAASNLRPPPEMLATRTVPAYESRIDHAGLIREHSDQKAFERGQVIFNRLCANCHGTPDKPGSLPISRKFESEPLKNGRDPYSIYRTLTYGFERMEPQAGLVPRQKYDVIHYLREAYLKPHNPSQFTPVDDAYLASLPSGTTQGPEPSAVEPWTAMDYGPFLMATYEVGDDASNFACKGIAVRVDPGPGGVSQGNAWMLYDHDTLRLAAAWSGSDFIDWRSIHFNGEHGIHPRIVGDIAVANPTGPGWANPQTGSFDDVRLSGRDGRRTGPLPHSWAKYRGLFRHGSHVVLAYDIGKTPVLESPSLSSSTGLPVFTRIFRLGARPRPLTLQVARHPNGSASLAP